MWQNMIACCFRLYSCLANGSADEFQKGEHLFKAKAVKDALQIGKYGEKSRNTHTHTHTHMHTPHA